MNEESEYVYRLVGEETGNHLQAYTGQYVYSTLGVAKQQMTKSNKNTWRNEKAVIQRGLIQWSTEPV